MLPLLVGSDDSLVPSELQLQFQPQSKSQNQAPDRHLWFPERADSMCPAPALYPAEPQRVQTLLQDPGPCSIPGEPPASPPDWALRPGHQLRFGPQLLQPGEVVVWEQTTSVGFVLEKGWSRFSRIYTMMIRQAAQHPAPTQISYFSWPICSEVPPCRGFPKSLSARSTCSITLSRSHWHD